jgi:hypothetical protein
MKRLPKQSAQCLAFVKITKISTFFWEKIYQFSFARDITPWVVGEMRCRWLHNGCWCEGYIIKREAQI